MRRLPWLCLLLALAGCSRTQEWEKTGPGSLERLVLEADGEFLYTRESADQTVSMRGKWKLRDRRIRLEPLDDRVATPRRLLKVDCYDQALLVAEDYSSTFTCQKMAEHMYFKQE
jgi:hypothetical protein